MDSYLYSPPRALIGFLEAFSSVANLSTKPKACCHLLNLVISYHCFQIYHTEITHVFKQRGSEHIICIILGASLFKCL